MRDEQQPPDLRLNTARIAAPYLHPKPQPEPRVVAFDLPEQLRTPAALLDAHTNIIRAVADSELTLEDAKDISAILDNQRRIIELSDLEARIVRLEQVQGKWFRHRVEELETRSTAGGVVVTTWYDSRDDEQS